MAVHTVAQSDPRPAEAHQPVGARMPDKPERKSLEKLWGAIMEWAWLPLVALVLAAVFVLGAQKVPTGVAHDIFQELAAAFIAFAGLAFTFELVGRRRTQHDIQLALDRSRATLITHITDELAKLRTSTVAAISDKAIERRERERWGKEVATAIKVFTDSRIFSRPELNVSIELNEVAGTSELLEIDVRYIYDIHNDRQDDQRFKLAMEDDIGPGTLELDASGEPTDSSDTKVCDMGVGPTQVKYVYNAERLRHGVMRANVADPILIPPDGQRHVNLGWRIMRYRRDSYDVRSVWVAKRVVIRIRRPTNFQVDVSELSLRADGEDSLPAQDRIVAGGKVEETFKPQGALLPDQGVIIRWWPVA